MCDRLIILGREGYPGVRGEKGLPGIPGKMGRQGKLLSQILEFYDIGSIA